MRADYHIHSSFSDDSVYEPELIVKDAAAMGLDEICFTDHVDYGVKKDWDEPGKMLYRKGGFGEPEQMALANVDYPTYYETILKLKKEYSVKINIKLGLAFGMQLHTIEKYERLFRQYPFDFIILSVHEIDDKEFWNQDFQKSHTRRECYERYYEDMLYLVRHFHNYSVLGHMDLIKRYDLAGCYSFEKTKPLVREILKTVIADGKGIEINTSSHRYGLKDSMPSGDILKLYRDLGGQIITIGSDSHKPEHLGAYIDEAKEYLLTLGFKEYCTFEKMQPMFHKL